MVNSHHTNASRENIIRTQQTGAAAELTLLEQIAILDDEIRKAKSWAEYYTNPKNPKAKNPKMALSHTTVASNLEMKREELKALYYVSLMPTLDEALADFDAETLAMQWEQNELDQHTDEGES